jgi:hypothetical protein
MIKKPIKLNSNLGARNMSKNHTGTIMLKIFTNYSKIMTFLLSYQNFMDINLDIGISYSFIFSKMQTVSNIFLQVNPSIDCLILGIKLLT